MIKFRNLKLAVVILTFVISISLSAQEKEIIEKSETEFSIEIDPATFAFSGYGFHLRVKQKNSERFLMGIGAYAMDMPDALVDFNKNNKGKGWNVRLNQGYGVFGEHHFSEVNKKWFVGAQTGIQEYKIENETVAGSEKFTNILAMGYFGYTIKPFKNNLYIKPWAGIGYTSKISGNNTLGALEYDIAPITMFVTLHIGYTF